MTIPGPESNVIAFWDFRVEIDGDFALATRMMGTRHSEVPGQPQFTARWSSSPTLPERMDMGPFRTSRTRNNPPACFQLTSEGIQPYSTS